MDYLKLSKEVSYALRHAPQNRQYVHLSVDIETAYQVGKRRDSEPVILKISALEAWNEGISFYCGNQKVWLADLVPSKYIIFE